MRADGILALVDEEQRQAVQAPPGPLLVVAGAGTGKTRTLTCRVAYRVATGQVPGGSVLAVTHSTRAAGEMQDRFRRMGVDQLELVSARTVHSAALRQLRYFWSATGRRYDLKVVDDRYARLRMGLATLGAKDVSPAVVTELLGEIDWAKTQLVAPEEYEAAAAAAGRGVSVDFARTAAAFRAYDAQLHAAEQIDFTDILTMTARLIETNDRVASEIRSRYRTLCVDEYQDVDPAQQRLIDAWLGESSDITAVGDPRQSIYAFKGADPELLTSFPARYPDTTVVTLTRDYRSTPQVVAVANSLAHAGDPAPGPKPRAKAARAAWTAAHPSPLTGMRPDGPTATVRCLEDEQAEAKWVAGQVSAALRSGTPAHEIAVLYRSNAQSAPFEQALTAAGIPYRVIDGERFFDRGEVRAVVEEMRRRLHLAYAPPGAPDPRPFVSYDEDSDDDSADSAAEYEFSDADQLSGASLLREVLHDYGFRRDSPPDGAGATRDRWEALRALLALVEDLPGSELIGPEAVLADLDSRREEAHQVATRAVTLSSIHKAKGLEWDVVFCPRLVEGSLPNSFARDEAAIAEERRVAYVAVTRARRVLLLSHAQTRTFGTGRDARSRPAEPSRFLLEAGLVVADGATRAPAPARPARKSRQGDGSAGATVVRCKRCSVPLADPSAVILGRCSSHLDGEAGRRWVALREWRTETSRMESQPPYRVLSDETVLALVAHAPADLDALAGIRGIGPSKLQRYGATVLSILHR